MSNPSNKELAISALKSSYRAVAEKYTAQFVRKHDTRLDFWVCDEVGTTACIGDYYFSFDDIRRDIDLDLPVGVIHEWHDYIVEIHPDYVNLEAYSKGVRASASTDAPKEPGEQQGRPDLPSGEGDKCVHCGRLRSMPNEPNL